MNLKEKELNKWLKIKYIVIKRIRTKSHIKIKCQWKKLKKTLTQ